MLIGMGVVFTFLIILIIYMKLVPILSRQNRASKSGLGPQAQEDSSEHQKLKDNADTNTKLKLNSVLNQLSNQTKNTEGSNDKLTELKVAAIAAAIYSHTGKQPRQIVITTPTGTVERINLWGTAGRQDLMLARDVTGQVGFQY